MSEPKIKTALVDVVEELGRHFNISSKSSFINMLIEMDNKDSLSSEVRKLQESPPEHRLGELFLQSTEGSLGIVQLIKELDNVLSGSPDLQRKASGMMRILFEPAAMNQNLGAASVALRILEENGSEYTGSYSKKYIENPENKLNENISNVNDSNQKRKYLKVTGSIKDLMWSEKVSAAMRDLDSKQNEGATVERTKEEWMNINAAFPSEPEKDKPYVSCFLIDDPQLSPATRDSSVVSLFTAFAPTLEMSRAQPYLNITLVFSRSPLNDQEKVDTISLTKFLLGTEKISQDPNDPIAITTRAVDANLLKDPQYYKKKQTETLSSIATSGMELFTAPQMLVPADEISTTPDYSASVGGSPNQNLGSITRITPLIDRFRPLASITSFSINVTPSGGMMTHKTAELSIILHDRSRLGEIGELIKPDMYGNTELLIEYGWSHPDAFNIAADISQNPFSSILNAMRVKEKFKISNSSFSFDDSGQVEIKLSLFTVGVAALETNDISKGPHVQDKFKEVKKFLDIIKEIRKKTSSSSDNSSDVTGETWLASINSPGSIRGLSKDVLKEMAQWRRSSRNSKSSTTQELVKALDGLLGNNPDKVGGGGALGDLQTTIEQALAGKLEILLSADAGDPFWNPVYPDEKRYCNIRNSAATRKDEELDKKKSSEIKKSVLASKSSNSLYVSLGKLLMTYAVTPLAVDGAFDEIQVFFYTFNEQASFMANRNIAEFPIELNEFLKELDKMTQQTAYIPVNKFLEMLSSKFVSKTSNPAYGLAQLYKPDEEGNLVIKDEYKKNSTALHDEKQKRLHYAYDSASASADDAPKVDVKFRQPRLTMITESVPSMNPGDEKSENSFTILKIHIYDKSCTPYSTLQDLLKAARNDGLGQISSTARPTKDKDGKEIPPVREAIIKAAEDTKIIEPIENTGSQKKYRIIGGFQGIKQFIRSSMPSIIYGAQNTAVIKASVTSMNDPNLATIHMLRSDSTTSKSPSSTLAAGLPLRVSPVELSLELFGCPLIGFGQQYFFDFGTGTSIDNVYAVTSIDHSLAQGEFKTNLKLTQLDAYGVYESTLNVVNDALSPTKESSPPK